MGAIPRGRIYTGVLFMTTVLHLEIHIHSIRPFSKIQFITYHSPKG